MLKIGGISLIELMVALSLSSIGLLATSSLLVSTTTQYYKLEKTVKLQNELNLVVSVLAEDIQNAGFDGHSELRDDPLFKPPSPFKNALTISSFENESSNSCITFAHDMNANGILNTDSPNERRGYRLREGAIEVRMNGNTCKEKGWQDLTSTSQLVIDKLEFKESFSPLNNGISRTISLSITAKLRITPNVQRSLTTQIYLGNYFE